MEMIHMKAAVSLFALLIAAAPCPAQEVDEFSSAFSKIKGGAVYDGKQGLDGAAITDEYLLTHATCTNGSRTVRVLVPLGKEDNETFFTLDGTPSTLKQTAKGWSLTFTAYGKPVRKNIAFKPVEDKASHYKEQIELTVRTDEALWKAMRDKDRGKAMALIGTGGTNIELPDDAEFTKFLAACHIAE
jgi:hypothetical protein